MFEHLKSVLYWNSTLNVFMKVIESHLNRWYIWGGDDPQGFDCSGLIVEGLRAVGYIGNKDDFTAESLWQEYRSYASTDVRRGSLVFYFHNTTKKAIHVGVAINRQLYITADGGGSNVKTTEDAIVNNAYVKIRPIDGRTTHRRYINLF